MSRLVMLVLVSPILNQYEVKKYLEVLLNKKNKLLRLLQDAGAGVADDES